MRVVLDTNTAISGMLWTGAPQQLLDEVHDGIVRAFTCQELLDEIRDVLNRPKLIHILSSRGVKPSQLLRYYQTLCSTVRPAPVGRIVLADPDDDVVIACAIRAKAGYIVTGDLPLRSMGSYKGIRIVSAAEMLEILRR